MKLHATLVPYSSTVGGGLMLLDRKGQVKFQIMLMGSTEGITKEESDQISDSLCGMINDNGLEIDLRRGT